MYTYSISDDLFVHIFDDENLEIVDDPGPFISFEEADDYASRYCEALNNGTKSPVAVPDPEE
jgi:hypothetical protein